MALQYVYRAVAGGEESRKFVLISNINFKHKNNALWKLHMMNQKNSLK